VSDQPHSRTLTDMYVERIHADLARIEAEIADARARLEELDRDRVWLLGLLDRLPSRPQAAQETAGTEADAGAEAAAPEAATSEAAAPAAAASEAVEETAPGGEEPAPVRRSAKRSGRSGPTLRDLVVKHLAALDGPTTVHEATVTVNDSGLVRQASTVVVRNTLESLVAGGIAERSKQGRSVYYTLAPTARS
jgi:hypothetical protein